MHCVMQADQINCLKLLEILDFGLALASRQPAPGFPQGFMSPRFFISQNCLYKQNPPGMAGVRGAPVILTFLVIVDTGGGFCATF